jgi:hypothetical protein
VRRAEYGPALLASIYCNTHRDDKKRPKPFTLADFMPSAEKTSDRQSAGELKSTMQAWVQFFGQGQ